MALTAIFEITPERATATGDRLQPSLGKGIFPSYFGFFFHRFPSCVEGEPNASGSAPKLFSPRKAPPALVLGVV